MSPKINNSRPEFLVNCSKVLGVPLGRIYVPYPWTTRPEFLHLFESVLIYEETLYLDGAKVVWFIAPISVYRHLALWYPHSRHDAYTQYLLKAASTFFSSLKPPYGSDYTDVD